MQKIPHLLILLTSSFLSFGQKTNKNLNDFFSKSEIQGMNLIADFVQEELCEFSDSDQFADCITKSIPNLVDFKQKYLQKKISWRKQKKLYAKIGDSTFFKIWSLCDSWQQIKPEYKYKTICFSGNSDFINFVDSLVESSAGLEGYGRRLGQ